MMSFLKRKEIENLDEEIGNLVFKIAAAATGCYQPLDLATLFKLLNTKMRTLTRDDNESDLCRIFREQLSQLRDKEVFLCRNQKRINNLIGIIGVCPQAYQETFTRDRMQQCFVTSGDLSKCANDKKIYGIADVNSIMDRCIVDWNENHTQICSLTNEMTESKLKDYFKSLIPPALHDNREYPNVREEWFEGRLSTDERSDGTDYLRDPKPMDYSLHRALIVHHEYNRRILDGVTNRMKEKKQNDANRTYQKYKVYFDDNEKCEKAIRKAANICEGAPLLNISKKILQARSVKRDYLFAFLKLRDNADITASTSKIAKNKGLSQEVEDGNPNILITQVYESIKESKPILADESQLSPLRTIMLGEEFEEEAIETPRPEETFRNSSEGVSKQWVLSQDFVRTCCVLIDSLDDKGDTFKEEAAEKYLQYDSTLLTSQHLLPRYASLLSTHGITPSHFTVRWMEKNVSRAASILKLHGTIKNDSHLAFTQLCDSLFQTKIICEEFEYNDHENVKIKRIGAYLMRDSLRDQLIRGGSTSTSFSQRLHEHSKASNLKSAASKDSRLYGSYPSSDATKEDKQATSCKQMGTWGDIKTSMAVGWVKDKSKVITELFEWDEVTMKRLENNRVNLTIEKKQERMLVYLFETVLQLSLCPANNISSNPGYEIFNGTFAR